METILVGTLGAEPQVITLATDLLLRRAVLTRVVVVHTDARFPPIAEALSTVREAFSVRRNAPSLECVGIDVADTLTPLELDRFADSLFAILKTCIGPDRSVHLLLAGGRKSMALVGLSIAQLLLGPNDHVWYLHSDDVLRQSGRLWLEDGDSVQLIEIPLAPPVSVTPRFSRSFTASNPFAARQALSDAEKVRLRYFITDELTDAERTVAALFIQEVMTVKEAASRLKKSEKTVTNQLSAVYDKMESYFGLTTDIGTKREFLRQELGAWFGS